jgi:hypothetical protein
MIRCPKRFRHRMGHADLLHADLWWKGQNVAIDPGTFSYNATESWNDGWGATSLHNTVTVSGRDQAEKVSRFLRLPWPQGECRVAEATDLESLDYWEGEHDAYRKRSLGGVVHRRGLARIGEESWVVLDALIGSNEVQWEVNWLITDWPYKLSPSKGPYSVVELNTPKGEYHVRWLGLQEGDEVSMTRAGKDSNRGWCSRYYNSKEPALSFRLKLNGINRVFATVFAPKGVSVINKTGKLTLIGEDWFGTISLSKIVSSKVNLVDQLTYLKGSEEEKLVVN